MFHIIISLFHISLCTACCEWKSSRQSDSGLGGHCTYIVSAAQPPYMRNCANVDGYRITCSGSIVEETQTHKILDTPNNM